MTTWLALTRLGGIQIPSIKSSSLWPSSPHPQVQTWRLHIDIVIDIHYSARNSSWKDDHPDKTVIEILTIMDYDLFAALDTRKDKRPQHRGDRYEKAKKVLEEKLLSVLFEVYPQIRSHVDLITSGSPLTNDFYLGSVVGEVYGLSHTLQRFSGDMDWILRPRQEIKGLYLTGQDILCGGIMSALVAGVMTASTLDKSVVMDLISSFLIESL